MQNLCISLRICDVFLYNMHKTEIRVRKGMAEAKKKLQCGQDYFPEMQKNAQFCKGILLYICKQSRMDFFVIRCRSTENEETIIMKAGFTRKQFTLQMQKMKKILFPARKPQKTGDGKIFVQILRFALDKSEKGAYITR